MKNWKKISLGALLTLLILIGFTSAGHSKMKAYYSGDAVYYNDTLVAASTNSDSLEIFSLDGQELNKFVDIKAPLNRYGQNDPYFDVKLNVEDDRLFAYAISDYSIYKYDISDLQNANLVGSQTNTYWEWYNRLDTFNNHIVTVSNKGVKVWNNDLQVIDTYDVKNDQPSNIRFSTAGDYIFNIHNDSIDVFDVNTRQVVKQVSVDYKSANDNHTLYYDTADQAIYTLDDRAVKKINQASEIAARFVHSGNPGYDIASSDDDFVYFTNGIGLVKSAKSNLKPVTWAYTGGINGDNGWAMGLKVVANENGNKVVVFNNSSILVMSSNLKLIAAVRWQKEDTKVEAPEALSLEVNKIADEPGATVKINGGGYYPNEALDVKFGTVDSKLTADDNGRFEADLLVPDISAAAMTLAANMQATTTPKNVSERVDIKVTGLDSGLHYSSSFEIKSN